MNLKQKIIEIRKQVAFLQKDTQAYQYKYVSEDKVLFAIKDKMDELGVLLVPTVTNHSVREFEYVDKKGHTQKENVVQGDMTFTWLDADSDEQLVVPFALYGQQQDSAQAFGSGLTYSNRYFLLKFFQVATNENDPDKVRSTKNKKVDQEYDEIKQTKSRILDKTYAECTVNGQLNKSQHTNTMKQTLEELGFTNWKSYDPTQVSEHAFMSMFQSLLSEQTNLKKEGI